jgi:hypothetical protein
MKSDNQTTDMFDEVIGTFTPQPLEVKPAKPKRIVIKSALLGELASTPVDRDSREVRPSHVRLLFVQWSRRWQR